MNECKLLIERFRTPFFRSLIEISPKNKNYSVFKKIEVILRKENKPWDWLFKRVDIADFILKTYMSGKENISLKSIEAFAVVLKPYIKSPRDLMNDELPILKFGKTFKLNLNFIVKKYGITQGEIARFTDIDSGSISNLVREKASQIGPYRLVIIYDCLKSRGVPLRNVLDLVYFPSWEEEPSRFLKSEPVRNLIFKHNGSMRLSR